MFVVMGFVVCSEVVVVFVFKIQSGGDLCGLYKYMFSSVFMLFVNSVVMLFFLMFKLINFECYVGLEIYFNIGIQDGIFNCFYCFMVDDCLFVGFIIVCEEGCIVGQMNISDICKGGKVEFSLGDDFDVYYICMVQIVIQVKNDKGNVIKMIYKVIYVFESSKICVVWVEIIEWVGGCCVIIDSVVFVQNQGIVMLKVDVFVGGKVSWSFMVIVDNG